MTRILRIAARRPGFRRCGVSHPGEPVDHPIDRFTADEVARLKAEPRLIVEEVTVAEPALAEVGDPEAREAGLDGGEGGPAADAEASRDELILRAMHQLGEDPGVYTASGKPKVEVLEQAVGFNIDAEERDRLWAQIEAARALED